MRWLIRSIFYLVVGFIGLSLALVLLFKVVPVPVTATMVADGNGIAKEWTALANIDRDMVRAVIAAEDGKFCTHDGFDREAIENAIRRNAEGGRIRGGSTISQQTAKNVFLWQGGGYFRKGLEAWITVLIEQIWGKRRIMEVYLNVAETGIGTYGVEAGARRYFGKSAGDLTPLQAARMAAALPLPKERSVKNPRGWLARHGNSISRRIGIVARDGLDACVYQ
ncbi:monofunctional biosynthetic peptidoglycan transglycosylase [Qipengyuania sp.]|uniref:monofunctional biosynthetic peptidoglycan transglycosylase n=1 Tax=Qipengyuania sp. TaxID=2004515 RepID=UPI00373575A8